jgi:hypothetical protein
MKTQTMRNQRQHFLTQLQQLLTMQQHWHYRKPL